MTISKLVETYGATLVKAVQIARGGEADPKHAIEAGRIMACLYKTARGDEAKMNELLDGALAGLAGVRPDASKMVQQVARFGL